MTARIHDNNGWYEIKANPLSKAGVYEYTGAMLGGIKNGADPGTRYKVYRPADELRSQATLDSFRLVPLVNDHTMLGKRPGYMDASSKGVYGVVGDGVFFDEADSTLKGNLKVYSATDIDSAMDGGKVELSCGYHCQYVPQRGTAPSGEKYDYVQRNIRGNHLALVSAGRMGADVRVLDAIETFTFDAKDAVKMAVTRKEVREQLHNAKHGIAVAKSLKAKTAAPVFVALDAADDDGDNTDMSLSDIADILADVMPVITDLNTALLGGADPDEGMDGKPPVDGDKKVDPDADPDPDDKTVKPASDKKEPFAMDAAEFTATVDAAIAKATAPLLADIAKLTAGNATAVKTMAAQFSKRDALAKKVQPFVGVFDATEMDTTDVAKYAIEKLSIPTVDGAEVLAVEAWLHGRTPSRPAFASVAMDGAERKPGHVSSVKAYINGAE